jgi:hypothetical protein
LPVSKHDVTNCVPLLGFYPSNGTVSPSSGGFVRM